MKRVGLAIGGAVVVAAAILLYLKLRGGGSDATPRSTGSASATTVAIGDPPAVGGSAGSAAAWAGSATGGVTTGPDGTTTYQVGGYTVRDHRKGTHEPIDIPPNLHPPDQRKVAPTLVRDLTNQVRDVVVACAHDLPADARGPKPKVEGEVTIAIKDHQVTVSSSVMQLRDVVGAAVDPTRTCITDKLASITQAAPDEPDVASYQINMSVAIL